MLELNMQGVFRKLRKIQNISYFQFTICPMDPNGSIRGCYLVASRGKGAVCKDHAVAAEIVVVGHFSRKIAAVAQGAVLPYAVDTPFPNAPAAKLERRVGDTYSKTDPSGPAVPGGIRPHSGSVGCDPADGANPAWLHGWGRGRIRYR